MKRIHIDYFGMPGEGATVKEAKEDAGKKLLAAMKEDYCPVALRFNGHLAFVWREPRGVASALVCGDASVTRLYGSTGSGTIEEELVRQKHSLAQLGWDRTNDDECLAFAGPDNERELRRWFAWQRDYARLIAEGKSRDEAHAMACGMARG